MNVSSEWVFRNSFGVIPSRSRNTEQRCEGEEKPVTIEIAFTVIVVLSRYSLALLIFIPSR